MKCLSEIFPIWNHLYFLKKLTLPTKFNSVLPEGLVPKLFLCDKVIINQNPFSSSLEFNPICPADRSSGTFGGENSPNEFLSIFPLNNMGWDQGSNKTRNFLMLWRSLHICWVWNLQLLLSKTSPTEPWYQTQLRVPLNPLPAAPTHLYTGKATLSALWAVPSRNLGMSTRIRGMNASSV